MHLSLPKQFPLLILASSVCWSLKCLISALTQRARWWSLLFFFFFRAGAHLFSRALGREEHCKQILLACVHSDSATLGLPHSRRVCFPSLHCSDSRLLCWKLSDVGPGLHALPRPKSLRFRFSGTPQRRRLGWACVLHPSQV